MRTLKSISFLCIFHVLSYLNSQQWFLRQAERWILRCCSWCSFWKGKWQQAPLSSIKNFCTYHLNLSTVFNSLTKAPKSFTCGIRVCGFITWSESITAYVNLMNSSFSSYIFLCVLFNFLKKSHTVQQYQTSSLFLFFFYIIACSKTALHTMLSVLYLYLCTCVHMSGFVCEVRQMSVCIHTHTHTRVFMCVCQRKLCFWACVGRTCLISKHSKWNLKLVKSWQNMPIPGG